MVEIMHPQFAANLRSAMDRRGLSVTDIARHLGITYEMARRYTLGTAKPRTKKLAELADFLGITPANLEYGQLDAYAATQATTPQAAYAAEEPRVEYPSLTPQSAAIGKRVKVAREKTGKPQNEFALACGITQQALSKIESGRTESPTADFVAKVAEQSGCSIEWLITGEEQRAGQQDDTPNELKALFQEIKLAYNSRSLSPALVSSFRNMMQALAAQQQDIATNAAADAKAINLGKKLSAKAINLPPDPSDTDKTNKLDTN